MQYIDVVVGGQYGSEAKGHVTAQLIQAAIKDATDQDIKNFELWNIRVAGPNAGHTVYDQAGNKYAFRQLPVGAVIHPDVKLYIAPGSEIDIEVLREEILQAEQNGWAVKHRLWISPQATVITDEHKLTEAMKDLTGRVGSTGKGIGAARADRIWRTAQTIGQYYETIGDDTGDDRWRWADPEDLYASDKHTHEKNQNIVVEGTQGYGLSLRASGNYPYTTSSDCRSIDFLAMAGIDPTRHKVQIQTWVVARVHPIRVAGNSGEIKGETTWEDLGLEAEKTTVTQKTRRVGIWDPKLVAQAVQANGGYKAKVIITMIDQVVPEMKDYKNLPNGDIDRNYPALGEVEKWLNENATFDKIGAKVAGFTYSPTGIIWINTDLRDSIADTLRQLAKELNEI